MLQGQCGSSPACPAGFETHSTDPSASYCAGATCDLVDDAAADDDVAYAHDLATCCEAASCAAFSTTFETTPTGYVATDASGTTVAGVGLACDADAHYAGTARC